MRTINLFAILFLIPTFVSAAIRHVPGQYNSIQSAISAASERDTVLVQPGVYNERINFTGKNVVIGSLFLTTGEIGHIDQTVIEGGNNGRPATFENGESHAACLIGFSLRNGSTHLGGGIFCRNSSPTLRNLHIYENRADDGGGIYCVEQSSPVISNVHIIDNTASEQGGGIHCSDNSNPTIFNSQISSNSASSGGGVYCNTNSLPALTDVDIIGNSAESMGGGIVCSRASNMRLVRVVVAENSADSLYGGGIYLGAAEMEIINTTVAQNSTNGNGGGLFILGIAELTVTNSIFYDNSPDQAYQRGSPDPAPVITVSYTNFEGGSNGFVIAGNGDLEWLNGNINADPLFRQTEEGDYFLRVNSPCIDTGDPRSSRDPDDTRADMGANFYDHREGITDFTGLSPSGFGLVAAYPNPFNSFANIVFETDCRRIISIDIFDASGRKVVEMVNGVYGMGRHSVVWNTGIIPSGLYIVRLHSDGLTHQLPLIKLR
ncbi:T9SS type A sorting domain-containing protein [bacterium]|nr:T9SS type A sorting domain-containing protein [bacterium]